MAIRLALLLLLVSAPLALADGPPATPPVRPTPEGRRPLAGVERGTGRAGEGTLDIVPDGDGWYVTRTIGGRLLRGPGQLDGELLRVRFGASGLAGSLTGDSSEVRAVYRLEADGSVTGLVRERTPDGREVWTDERGAPAVESPPAEATRPTPEEATPEEADDLRARIVRAARAARDLGWDGGPAERQQAYAELLFPHDSERDQRAFSSSMSSCGLFGMACLRQAGFEHACLATPYARQIGRAVTNLVVIGKERSAWVRASGAPTEPQSGDMVLVGSSVDTAAWGGVEHVLVVVERRGAEVVSVDGGQAGHSIRERTRRLERRGAQLWLTTDGVGRRIQGWLDVGKLD